MRPSETSVAWNPFISFFLSLVQLYLARIKTNWSEQNYEKSSILLKNGQNGARIGQKWCFLYFFKNFVINFSWK